MIDYGIYYKEELPLETAWNIKWDLFVSAYNSSQRVQYVFQQASAPHKHWLIHTEYGYRPEDFPTTGCSNVFCSDQTYEGVFIRRYVDSLSALGIDIRTASICVDITGFMRPHLMFMVRYFHHLGVKKFDAIYSEPRQYADKEETTFSDGAIDIVRQVASFEGTISADTNLDLLIIGAGYDYRLIAEVAEDKDKAEKIKILGLPSLRADMYQENVLRAYLASDAVGEHQSCEYFAPANDPFSCATVLSEIVEERTRNAGISNLYLSPLATKPQALGFALFYIGECIGKNASIIFPFSASYSKETSGGIARVWKFTIEFPIG